MFRFVSFRSVFLSDVLRYLFHLYPRSIHLRNDEHQTVLHLAASLGQISTCRFLIECGAQVNSLVRISNFQTPFDFALLAKQTSCAEILRDEFGGRTGDVMAKIFARRIQKFYRNFRQMKLKNEKRTKNPLIKQIEVCQENDDAHERRRIFAKSRTTLRPIDQNDESKYEEFEER